MHSPSVCWPRGARRPPPRAPRRRRPRSRAASTSSAPPAAAAATRCRRGRSTPAAASTTGPFGTVYATNITPDRQDGDRQLDRRADHHGHPPGPAAQRRAAPARAPLHGLQRDGRGGPEGPDGVPAHGAAGEPAEPAEEDHGAAVRVRVPAGVARRLRAQGDAAAQGADLRPGARRVPRAGGRPLRRVPHAARR